MKTVVSVKCKNGKYYDFHFSFISLFIMLLFSIQIYSNLINGAIPRGHSYRLLYLCSCSEVRCLY